MGQRVDPTHSKTNPLTGGQSRLKDGYIAGIPPHRLQLPGHFDRQNTESLPLSPFWLKVRIRWTVGGEEKAHSAIFVVVVFGLVFC